MENSKKKKHLYTVATAHLDTIWNWDFEYVISKCIPKTLKDNFRLFNISKDYKFNFEGAYRYELMEEYYPEQFKKLLEYVKEGRWAPCGSSYENGDVNVPSPEALIRNILIGNNYFGDKLGVRTNEIFLPDCFGFGYALPAIASHSNLKGFTTQKLSWGSAYGNPFDLGKWYGVDGSFIYGVLDPGSYTTDFSNKKYVKSRNIQNWDFVQKKLEKNEQFGLDCTVAFQGTGDQGGAPTVDSVRAMQKAIDKNSESDLEVSSDFIIDVVDTLSELDESVQEKLPTWNNELVMTYHGAGGYTSRAISKRWNSHNELLGDAAERMSVIGNYLGAREYPQEELNRAWKRVIAHHFHDDLPGTSVQRAYKRSWNDLAVSINQFSTEYDASVGAVASMLNTEVVGRCVVVSNPLEIERNECVTAVLDSGADYFRVFDGAEEVLSQTRTLENGKKEVTFIADIKPLAVKVFSFRESATPCGLPSSLRVTENTLENSLVKVTINENGEISSIFDIENGKEHLLEPIRFDIFEYFGTVEYPAWEIDYKEIACEPQYKTEFVSSEIVKNGAAKGEIKVVLKCDNSIFTYYVSLSENSDRVDVQNEIEWRDRHRLLKVRFPFEASSEKATYDLGLGAIERGNNTESLYEVPAQKWADLTDFTGEFGTSVLSDCKYGWDKPDNRTLRLTVIHTPMKNFHDDSMQSMMELGLNRFGFAIVPHLLSVGSKTVNESRKFAMPLFAFEVSKHIGSLGKEYSFGKMSTDSAVIRAIKKAEKSDEIIVRINEIEKKDHSGVTLKLGNGVLSAREVYGSEEERGEATVKNGCLVFDLKPYEIKSFALTLENGADLRESSQQFISLPFDIRVCSYNGEKKTDDIGGIHYTVPAEQFPETVSSGGITFKLGDRDEKNSMLSSRQKIELPENAKKLYVLAAELYGDREKVFEIGINTVKRKVAAIDEKVGGWDLYDLGETAFTKDERVAFEFTHAHKYGSDVVAKQSYLFVYEFDVTNERYFTFPKGQTTLVFAATVTTDDRTAKPLTEFTDKIEDRKFTYSMSKKERKNYRKYKRIATFKS
ncbi:MAG: alpha-mannosidase [Ruminococcaceae bacterium]|jgi:alpha-mannosidase|nr:alpha-mannosidase [Oscillospiraceae bacterium]